MTQTSDRPANASRVPSLALFARRALSRLMPRDHSRHPSPIYRAQLAERPSEDDEILAALRQDSLFR